MGAGVGVALKGDGGGGRIGGPREGAAEGGRRESEGEGGGGGIMQLYHHREFFFTLFISPEVRARLFSVRRRSRGCLWSLTFNDGYYCCYFLSSLSAGDKRVKAR